MLRTSRVGLDVTIGRVHWASLQRNSSDESFRPIEELLPYKSTRIAGAAKLASTSISFAKIVS
jgi:hypothetical protein